MGEYRPQGLRDTLDPCGGRGLAAANRSWRARETSDAVYLEATRRLYRDGLAAWTVGDRLGQVLAASHLTIDQIAYTNAARCQLPPRPRGGHAATQRRLVKACQRWLPLADVVEATRPRLVVTTSADLLRMLGPLPGDPFVVGLRQYAATWQPASPWRPDRPGDDPFESLVAEWRQRLEARVSEGGAYAPAGAPDPRAADLEETHD